VRDHEFITAGHCLLSERRLDTSRRRETFLLAATRLHGDHAASLHAVRVRACRVTRASGSSVVVLELERDLPLPAPG